MSSKPIILLDASALKKSACSLAFYRTLIEGWRQPINSTEIEFGSAFHRCPERLEITGKIFDGIKAARDYYLKVPKTPPAKAKFYSVDYLGYVCSCWYASGFMQDSFETLKDTNNLSEPCEVCKGNGIIKDSPSSSPCYACQGKALTVYPQGKPLVEMKFALPYYESEYCIIMLSGTMDRIARHKTSGLLAVVDYKTTGAYDPKSFLEKYELDGQLMFYTMSLRKHLEKAAPESILYKYRGKDIGACIDGIFVGADNKFEYRRSEVFVYSKARMEEYEKLVHNKCKEISKMIETKYVPRDGLLNGACTFCNFKNACAAPDKETEQFVLNRNFKQVKYNPLTFGKTV